MKAETRLPSLWCISMHAHAHSLTVPLKSFHQSISFTATHWKRRERESALKISTFIMIVFGPHISRREGGNLVVKDIEIPRVIER